MSKIKIFDINGKLVLSIKSFDMDIPKLNIQSLKKGIYFISIANNQYQFFTKILVKI
ncbi:T9SS type A sorting domain-containing protein [Bizionia arctica]|uniref:T9SS type A sorting domain-containing protein n=1 Tax=Bizionia arctica TaxID=1495645 RepID=UPI001662EE4B